MIFLLSIPRVGPEILSVLPPPLLPSHVLFMAFCCCGIVFSTSLKFSFGLVFNLSWLTWRLDVMIPCPIANSQHRRRKRPMINWICSSLQASFQGGGSEETMGDTQVRHSPLPDGTKP